jgi:hypothetical protein
MAAALAAVPATAVTEEHTAALEVGKAALETGGSVLKCD